MRIKLSEQLEYEDLTLEERLYEVEAARTEEYREIHKQTIADWIAKLEAENEALREMVMYCLRGHYVTEESGNEAHEIFPEYSDMIDALLKATEDES